VRIVSWVVGLVLAACVRLMLVVLAVAVCRVWVVRVVRRVVRVVLAVFVWILGLSIPAVIAIIGLG